MSGVINSCLTEISLNDTLNKQKGKGSDKTIGETIQENVCLNDCSNNGNCSNGNVNKIYENVGFLLALSPWTYYSIESH